MPSSRVSSGAVVGGSIPGEEQISIRPAAARRWYDRGHTLYVMRAEGRHELLRKHLLALGELVPHDFGSVGVFVSPAGAVSEWHFDQYDNITVQLGGSKRWDVSSMPGVAHPRGNYGLHEAAPPSLAYCSEALQSLERIDVESTHILPSGSALFVPAGMWHRVESEAGPSISISITFTFRRRARLDVLLAALEARLVKDAWWRGPAAEGEDELVELLRRPAVVEREA